MVLIRTLVIGVLAGWLFLTPLAHGAEQAGKVLFARGVVSAVDQQDSRRGLRGGDAVFEGERIVTGRNAIVQIHLSDGALLGLRSNSDYLIKSQKFGPESGIAEQAGELFSGWMRMVTGAIGKSRPDNVRVGSSVATIGIRGTVFQLIHVPEEGLEGFNDVEPGSYVMLEDGRINFFNSAGSRRLSPGEVAFVGLAQRSPQPRPDRQEMFARRLQERIAARQQQTQEQLQRMRMYMEMQLAAEHDGGLNNSLQSVLDNELVQTSFVNLAALSSYSPGGRYQRLSAGEANLQLLETDQTRLVSGIRSNPGDGSIDRLFATGVAPPVAVGQTFIGGLASQVHWGIWRQGTFEAVNSVSGAYTPTGDWHYILASNVQPDPAILSSQLNGAFSYDYVGGTPLTNALGAQDFSNPDALGRIAGGRLQVDFSSNLMQAALALNLPNQGALVGISGGGTLVDFYTTGLGMANDVATVTGNMKGAFIGPTAEGAIASVGINDIGNNAAYQGTAVFERTGTAVSLP